MSSLKSYLETGKGTPGSASFFKQGTTKAAIVEERTIAVAPERVFKALTQPNEIGHWWTNDLNATAEVGSIAEFRFGEWGDFVLRFEVAELKQNEKVHWITKQGPPQWATTSVTWQLTPVHNGTQVTFTHDGFAQVDEAYRQARGNWEYFLDSLKSYLETGKGTPGSPRPVKEGRFS